MYTYKRIFSENLLPVNVNIRVLLQNGDFTHYRVSGKKLSLLIELSVGILLKLQLKAIILFQKPVVVSLSFRSSRYLALKWLNRAE